MVFLEHLLCGCPFTVPGGTAVSLLGDQMLVPWLKLGQSNLPVLGEGDSESCVWPC